jgi:hypothetical protein
MTDAQVDKLGFNACLKALREILMRHGFDFHTKPWVDCATLRKVIKCLLKLERDMGNSLLQGNIQRISES